MITKLFKFRKMRFEVKLKWYGQYEVTVFSSKEIFKFRMNDSYDSDWCSDESNMKKCMDARRSIYNMYVTNRII